MLMGEEKLWSNTRGCSSVYRASECESCNVRGALTGEGGMGGGG